MHEALGDHDTAPDQHTTDTISNQDAPEVDHTNANYRAIVSEHELVDELERKGKLTELVLQALDQAKESHSKEIRRDGTPYLDGHVLPIAYDLAVTLDLSDPDYEASLVAALLHDTVEDDPNFPPDRLLQSFPSASRSVMLLTNHPFGHEPNFTEDWQKLDFNTQYITRIHQSGDRVAQLVKLADRFNNSQSAPRDPSLVVTGPDDPDLESKAVKQGRKITEMRELFLPMAQDVSPVYHTRLTAICDSLEDMHSDAQRMLDQVRAG